MTETCLWHCNFACDPIDQECNPALDDDYVLLLLSLMPPKKALCTCTKCRRYVCQVEGEEVFGKMLAPDTVAMHLEKDEWAEKSRAFQEGREAVANSILLASARDPPSRQASISSLPIRSRDRELSSEDDTIRSVVCTLLFMASFQHAHPVGQFTSPTDSSGGEEILDAMVCPLSVLQVACFP